MSKVLEVEIRYKIPNKTYLKSLYDKLNKLGFHFVVEENQEDIYFSSHYKDFLKNEECLRIRTVKGSSMITWKPPSSKEMKRSDDFWKQEIDLRIGSQREIARQLLQHLDFFEVAIVKKRRQLFKNDENVLVSIDQIAEIGEFLEIEVQHSNIQYARKKIRDFAKLLEVDNLQIVNIPYRDLILNKNG